MVYLFNVMIPHYQKDIDTVNLLIYWIKGADKAAELKTLCENDYLSYKEKITGSLGLLEEYDTAKGAMFHSYQLYQLGQTLFIYDKASFNDY